MRSRTVRVGIKALGGVLLSAPWAARVAAAENKADPPAETATPSDDFTDRRRVRNSLLDDRSFGLARDLRTPLHAPSLPDLMHRTAEMGLEQTLASVRPVAPTSDGSRLLSWFFTLDGELPLGSWFYVGASFPFAIARSGGEQEPRFYGGNPALSVRAVHPISSERFTLGAGFGVLPPLATYDELDDATRITKEHASILAGIIRPWEMSSFLERRVTLRPWVDLRAGSRGFTVQFRQSVDFGLPIHAPSATDQAGLGPVAGNFHLFTISALFLGIQPTTDVSIGMEFWEVYLLSTSFELRDQQRSAFMIAPSVRFASRWVEPSISVVMPIGPALLSGVGDFFSARLNLRIWLQEPKR